MTGELESLAAGRWDALTAAEQQLFHATAGKQWADYAIGPDRGGDRARPAKDGSDGRVLRADRLVWLCTDRKASRLVSQRGICVRGAIIDGDLDLADARIRFPLFFRSCVFNGAIDLRNSATRTLDLAGSRVCSLDCACAEIENGLYLCDGFHAAGTVRLAGATVNGPLDCTGAALIQPGHYALEADDVDVRGPVLLANGFVGEGMVSLVGARIRGNLECNQGAFWNPGKVALNAERLCVAGDVFLCTGSWGRAQGVQAEGFRAAGEVKLTCAKIGGTLECRGGRFVNPKGTALQAPGLEIKGNVLFHHGFRAAGMVRLIGATIGGNLECNQGEFINEGGIALDADRLNVGGDVFLCTGSWGGGEGLPATGFRAAGEVKLVRAKIGGSLDCTGGRFVNPGMVALHAAGLRVEGNILLSAGFMAEGEVDLLGAALGGNLEAQGGEFRHHGHVALNAERLNAGGDVFLCEAWEADDTGHMRPFRAVGEVKLVGARINGSVSFRGASFANEEAGSAGAHVRLFGATVGRIFFWTDIVSPEGVRLLDLGFARMAELVVSSWPEQGTLRLGGLVYDHFNCKPGESARSCCYCDEPGWVSRLRLLATRRTRFTPSWRIGDRGDDERKAVKRQIQWLQRQGGPFHHQPYEQLAAVLRRDGRESDARTVLVAKAKRQARQTHMTFPARCWHGFLGLVIGYGYHPWRALGISFGLVLLGAALFGWGYRSGAIAATREMESVFIVDAKSADDGGREPRVFRRYYPQFSALMYSLDVFIPLLDLHQAKYWLPNAQPMERNPDSGTRDPPAAGRLLRAYMWFHIGAGWVLTTLLFAGLTGLVRH